MGGTGAYGFRRENPDVAKSYSFSDRQNCPSAGRKSRNKQPAPEPFVEPGSKGKGKAKQQDAPVMGRRALRRARLAEANGGKLPKAGKKQGSRKAADSDDEDEERVLADARKCVSFRSLTLSMSANRANCALMVFIHVLQQSYVQRERFGRIRTSGCRPCS